MGAVGFLLIVALAFIGPYLSPHSPSEIVGQPFLPPSGSHLIGTDVLGRDVLSRFLNGGRILIVIAFVATVLAYVLGTSVGMIAGYRRGFVDFGTVGAIDLLLAFPPIVFILMLLTATGPRLSAVVLAIAVAYAPRIARIVRSVTVDVAKQEFVEAAVARGEPLRSILRRDVLANIWTPVLADFGLRFTGSLLLFSSLSYLGLGTRPPATDWGLMISENQSALAFEPWAIIVPAAILGILAICVNMLADSVARSAGRSVVSLDA